jgi:hypothetical protein
MIEFYHGFILRQKIAKCNYLQRILYEKNSEVTGGYGVPKKLNPVIPPSG